MMEMRDLTGQPPSARDVDEAVEVVTKMLVQGLALKIPPELFVQLPNIRRILLEYKKVARRMEKTVHTFAPGVLYCRKCGRGISRKRGNLRTRASLFRAIEALRLKHEIACTGVR